MTDEPGIELQRVRPMLFGWIPPLGLLGAGGASFLAAIALFATAHWLAASVLLVLALLGLGLYLVAARHLPPSPLNRRAVGGIWRARDELRFAGTSARAWTSAGREVLALQRELRRLGRQRDGLQHELGGAVYRGDDKSTAELRERMQELERRMSACAESILQARREAEEQVSTARVPLSSTEISKAPAGRSGPGGSARGKSTA